VPGNAQCTGDRVNFGPNFGAQAYGNFVVHTFLIFAGCLVMLAALELAGVAMRPSMPMDTRALPATFKSTAPAATVSTFQRFKFLWVALSFLLLLAAAIYALRYDLRSYVFLTQFLDPRASGLLVRLEEHGVDAQELTLSTTRGPVRARLYTPRGVAHPPGMVLVHGIHHLGIDEPRLVNFAHAAASNGFSVLTPEIAALADYHVDGASIGTIGESTAWLQERLGTGPVTIVGVSFAGGLSLLAACDPRYAPHIRALVLMGAYDNLGRVARFLATSQAEFPDGRMEPYTAHDYGAAVFVYSHLDQFFPASDLAVAHDSLRDWLWERPGEAQALFPQLSPPSRTTMEILIARQIGRLRPKLLDAIQTDDAQLSAISPEGKLGALRTPVFLLHGATDDIIPSTETLWLEKDIPKPYLRAALITPAFSHVDPDKHAVWIDQLRLVEFLAGVLREAD
jgi:pimeloyl-ACP methyl ester carboxylesterase